MLNEINTTVGGTIQDKFEAIVAKDAITNTFGSDTYNYIFGKYSVKFNSSMAVAHIGNSKGNSVGYIMSVVGASSTRRSTFVPATDERASYISLEMVQNMFDYQTTTADWKSMRVDSTMLISDMFQFYLIDLESIVTEALSKYPNLLSKLYATCGIQDLWDIQFDAQYQLIRVTARWECSLMMQDDDSKLLNVVVPLAYEVQVTQVGKTLRAYINNAMLNGDA